MADTPKRQHYLPRTILRNFINDGEKMLWYYDRKTDTYEQRTPKGIAHARNLYTYDGFGLEERYALEKAFSVLEGKAAPIFLKLQTGGDITQEEHTVISEFVGMQYHRTPVKLHNISVVMDSGLKYINENMRQEITNMTDEAFQKFISDFSDKTGKSPGTVTKQQFIDYFNRGTIKLNNPKNSLLSTLVDAGTHLAVKLSSRQWVVLHTSPDYEFITSDVGLHLTPDGKPTRITGYGPGSPDMAIIFPFAKNTALMITSKPVVNVAHVNFEDALVFVVNSGLARVSGQLYSSDKQLLERLVKTGSLAKTTFIPVFDEEQAQILAQKHFVDTGNQT